MLARTPEDDVNLAAPIEVTATPPQGWRVLCTLSLLMGFASISTDFYLPAMPVMGTSLGTTIGTIEWTISGYLIGFSLGQLLWGPISDRYGRRIPVAIGIVLFVIGSAGCALATSGASIIEWRLLQAAGASAGVVLSRAMVRDLYEGQGAARMLSTLITIMSIAPLVGPSLGGQILLFAGWRAIFWVLVIIGFVTLFALFTLPETLPRSRRSHDSIWDSLVQYGSLLKQLRIMAYAGVGGFFYAGMFAYVAGTPFSYINFHHLSAQLYGVLFAAGMIGIMATNMLNMRLVTRFGSDRMLLAGTAIAAASGLIVAVAAKTGVGGLWGIAVPLFMFASATGFIVANSIAGALNAFPLRSGAVSALIGAFQYGSGIIGSGLVGLLADGTPWPMGLVVVLSGIGSLVCALFIPRGLNQ